jgi:hypothetical protein
VRPSAIAHGKDKRHQPPPATSCSPRLRVAHGKLAVALFSCASRHTLLFLVTQPFSRPCRTTSRILLARRRQQAADHGGHLRWTDVGVVEDFLAEYRRVVGFAAHDLEQADRALRSDVEAPKRFFEEKKARLQSGLRRHLGLAARPYLIASTGPRGRQRFGLGLAAEQIVLDQTGAAS